MNSKSYNIVLKCKDCGTILVVNSKDLWKIGKCPTCESKNLVNFDDCFKEE